MKPQVYDIAVIGGGIVGCATAMALLSKKSLSLVVLEAEDRLAAHQTGNNSGVIHSGLYYKPGSLKARNCVQGREAMYRFCAEFDIAHDRCGKVVVATRESELSRLDDLEERGRANGLSGMKRLVPEEIREFEPHVEGIRGLLVPDTGIVDYVQVTEKFAEIVAERGGEVRLNSRISSCQSDQGELVLSTPKEELRCRHLINCAGLQSDRVARMCGVDPGLRIIPFRGEYYKLNPDREFLVKNLVYPVPDPAFPFLGVHFTRMIQGGVEAGPNAVLAFKREGYRKTDISLVDSLATFTYPGFIKLITKFWKMGMGEIYRSYSKKAFVTALQRLIPELQQEDVYPEGSGVRAQALEASGALVDDFRIVEAVHQIHVLNAPSPAATAAITIGEHIAGRVLENINL
jgi:L-2-hydroxyglutarate oxidase